MKNKKIIIASIALCMGVSPIIQAPINNDIAYAMSLEEKIKSIDTTNLEVQVKAAEFLLKNSPKLLGEENIIKLKKELERASKLLARVRELRGEMGEAKSDNLDIRVKNQIRDHLTKRSNDFTVSINSYTNNDEIQKRFIETAKEDRYFFYSMYERAEVSTKYNPNKKNRDKYYVESATFKVSFRESPDVEKEIEEFADNRVAQNITTNMSDYSKARVIHDFIVTYNDYNRGDDNEESGGYSIYSPASILYGEGGVCNAYATLFDILATKSGLEVRYATGISKRNGEPHIWNMVKVDGNRYNLDATFDDPIITFNDGYVENLEDYILYDYFLKSDNEIIESRSINEDPERPEANFKMNTGLTNARIEKVGDHYEVVR